MNRYRTARRGLGAAALGAALLLPLGCSDLLKVENPEEILEEELNNAQLIPILVNSVAGTLTEALDDPFIWRGSMFTDEQLTGINWEGTARLNQRITRFDEGDPDFMFSQLSAARAMADSVAGRFRTMLEGPASDERMAFTLAYAGYSYIFLADAMCEATINAGATVYQAVDLYSFAVDRFTEAMSVAQAANEPDLVNLARVGLARAHLNLGNEQEAMDFAADVPADFQWFLEYEVTGENNTLYTRTHGSNHALGVHPRFAQVPWAEVHADDYTGQTDALMTDPRIQHFPYWRTGHNRLTVLYTPYQGLRFSGYNGETIAEGGQPAEFERGTDILLADGLEARQHYFEALDRAGTDPAAVLAFVNERRAAGNQDPVVLAGQELTDELRDQRGRDLFLGGFRLGDLRRWIRLDGQDLFPSGQHPTTEWGQYGDATCFPLPLEEYEGNDNLNKP